MLAIHFQERISAPPTCVISTGTAHTLHHLTSGLVQILIIVWIFQSHVVCQIMSNMIVRLAFLILILMQFSFFINYQYEWT